MLSKVNPISKGSWGRYYAIHKPMAPASESLLITLQIQSTGNKQQQYQAVQTGAKGDCFCTVKEEKKETVVDTDFRPCTWNAVRQR